MTTLQEAARKALAQQELPQQGRSALNWDGVIEKLDNAKGAKL